MHRAGCTGAASLTDDQDPGIRQDRQDQCNVKPRATTRMALLTFSHQTCCVKRSASFSREHGACTSQLMRRGPSLVSHACA